MKNLPEKKMVDELRKRLANYTEDPDDEDWDKIVAAIPKVNSSAWLKYAAVGLFFFLYTSLVWLAGKYSAGVKENLPLAQQRNVIPSVADSCYITTVPPRHEANRNNEALQLSNVLPKQSISLNDMVEKDTIIYNDHFMKVAEKGTTRTVTGMINKENKASALSSSSHDLKNERVFPGDTIPPPKDSLIEKTDTVMVRKEIKKAKEKRNRLKPTVYFLVTPSLAFQKIVPFHNDEILITKLNSKGILSNERIGVAADIGLQWQLNKKLALYSGISYYQQDASISYFYQSKNVKQIDASSDQLSYLLSPGISSASFSYKMRNIGLSAGFLYHLQGVKLQHKIGGGLQYQIGFLRKNENRNSNYLNYQILYRMEFSLHPKYHFYVQPGFTHLIMSHDKTDEPMEIKPYRAGMGFGIVCYF